MKSAVFQFLGRGATSMFTSYKICCIWLAWAFCVLVVRRLGSQLATTLVATIFVIIFFSRPPLFSLLSTFLLDLRSKILFSKSRRDRPNPRGRHIFRPIVAIFDFAGVAGGEQVLSAPLGYCDCQKPISLSRQNPQLPSTSSHYGRMAIPWHLKLLPIAPSFQLNLHLTFQMELSLANVRISSKAIKAK